MRPHPVRSGGQIGVFSNRLLLWGILFELIFVAAVIYLPPLQSVFGTNPLGGRELSLLRLGMRDAWASPMIIYCLLQDVGDI